jgi:hypothetical protein
MAKSYLKLVTPTEVLRTVAPGRRPTHALRNTPGFVCALADLKEKSRRAQSEVASALTSLRRVRRNVPKEVAMRAVTENRRDLMSRFRIAHLGMGASENFRAACLWSALGLILTGLFLALGFGAEIGQIQAIAG